MSDNVKLDIRPLPHASELYLVNLGTATPSSRTSQGFVRGYPGIPPAGSIQPACIQGTVEVRTRQKAFQGDHTNKNKKIKALSLHLEIRKIEVIPGGKATSRYREPLGDRAEQSPPLSHSEHGVEYDRPGPIALWQTSNSSASTKRLSGASDAGYETLPSCDFPFHIQLADSLPASVLIDRKVGTGIFYEVSVTLVAKPKTGLFSGSAKAPERIIETATIIVEKHDLHPGWPIYGYRAQLEDRRESLNKLYMSVKRDTVAYGPGDVIKVNVKLQSQRLDPVKLLRIELVLKEVTTFRGDVRDPNSAGEQVNAVIVDAKQWINKTVYPQDDNSYVVEGVIPKDHGRCSVTTGKHINIAYHMGVRAVFEKERGTAAPVADLLIDFLPTVVAGFSMDKSDLEVANIIQLRGGIPEKLASPGPLPLRASALGDGESSSGAHSNAAREQTLTSPLDSISGFRLVNGSPSPPLPSKGPAQAAPGIAPQWDSAPAEDVDHTIETIQHAPGNPANQPSTRQASARRFPTAEEEKAALRRQEYEQISPSVRTATERLAQVHMQSPIESYRAELEEPPAAPTSASAHAVLPFTRAVMAEDPVTHPPLVQPVLDYASAEQEKQRLYDAAVGQRPVTRAPSGPAVPHWEQFGRSESEKLALYDNAVQDRENYDGPYAPVIGIPFASASEIVPHAADAVTRYERALAEQAFYQANSDFSELPTQLPDYPSADTSHGRLAREEKAYLAAQFAAEDAQSQAQRDLRSGQPTIEESKRLYEQAVAMREGRSDTLRASTGSRPAVPLPRVPQGPILHKSAPASGRSSEPPPLPPARTRPPPNFADAADEKLQLARYQAAQDAVAARRQQELEQERRYDMPGAYASPPLAYDNDARFGVSNAGIGALVRKPSSAESTSSGIPDEPRDPSIALGKRRAEPPLQGSPLAAAISDPESVHFQSGRRATYDAAFLSALHDPLWAEVGRPDARLAPARPPKVPLFSDE